MFREHKVQYLRYQSEMREEKEAEKERQEKGESDRVCMFSVNKTFQRTEHSTEVTSHGVSSIDAAANDNDETPVPEKVQSQCQIEL